MIKKITSSSNQLIRDIVRLKNEKKTNCYIIEGFRFFESVYNENKDSIRYVFIVEQLFNANIYSDIQDRYIIVTENVMKKISSLTTPPGVLVVCDYKYAHDIPETPGLVCYDVSDPGNLGSLFRSAAAFSINNIICINGVDPLNQKVVQASAGTIHLLNIYRMTENAFFKSAKNKEIVALSMNGEPILSIEKKTNRFLIVGNEAHGLPMDCIAKCSKVVTIPMSNNIESLNVAVAGSLAMFQLF